MTKEEILSSIKTRAEELGRVPTLAEVRRGTKLDKHKIQKHFLSYAKALAECGLSRKGRGYETDAVNLFKDWAGVARKLGKLPTMAEYTMHGMYSVSPLTRRYQGWTHVPAGMLDYARAEKLEAEWSDVLEKVTRHLAKAAEKGRTTGYGNRKGRRWGLNRGMGAVTNSGPDFGMNTGSSFGMNTGPNFGSHSGPGFGSNTGLNFEMGSGATWERSSPLWRTKMASGQPVYGTPLLPTPLSHAPTNELGVVFLFGSVARELGYMVMRLQPEFPDCEAMREVEPGRWQRLRIEFEYESRNFLTHMHSAEECELIVCWNHNWEDCPLEVLELKRVVS